MEPFPEAGAAEDVGEAERGEEQKILGPQWKLANENGKSTMNLRCISFWNMGIFQYHVSFQGVQDFETKSGCQFLGGGLDGP